MADGLRYLVEIDFQTKGDASGGLGKGLSGAASLQKDLLSGASKLGDAYTGLVDKAGSFALSVGKAALGAGIAASVYGVAKLNAGLESTKVSLAAVLSSNGITDNIEQGLARSEAWVKQIRKDAEALPGTFDELLQIVQSSAGSAFHAGMGVDQFEKMSSQAMAAGKALAVPLDQAGRELAQLLEGRAGTHNVLGSRLGIHAEGFNTKSAEERVKTIEAALQKFEPAIKAFSGTFDAQLGTFTSNVKGFAQLATEPLFEKVKGTLTEINEWFGKNKSTVDAWAKKIGDGLADAFETGKSIIKEYWPAFRQFAENAYDRFSAIWKDVKPLIESVGETIKEALSDPGTLDKIIDALKLYAAIKVGGAAFEVGGGIGKVVNGASGVASAVGAAGGLSGIGEAALGALTGAAGTAAAALTVFAGAVGVSVYYAGKQEDENEIVRQNFAQHYVDSAAMIAGGSGLIDTSSQNYLDTLEKLKASSEATAQVFKDQVEEHNRAIVVGAQLTDSFVNMNGAIAGLLVKMPHTNLVMDAAPAPFKDNKPKAGPAKGSGNTTLIVYQTISSNQAPDQIARKAVDEIVKAAKSKKMSLHAPNYTHVRR